MLVWNPSTSVYLFSQQSLKPRSSTGHTDVYRPIVSEQFKKGHDLIGHLECCDQMQLAENTYVVSLGIGIVLLPLSEVLCEVGLHVRCTKWNVVHRSSSWADIKMKETFTRKSLFIGIGLQDIHMCLCYICNYNFIYFECPKGTGAKPYSRPRTLASTGAKVPVAPVESAPMRATLIIFVKAQRH